MFEDEDFIALFVDEALDTLATFERACLDLEQAQNDALFDELFRAAHNLKGAAASVGLSNVASFVHRLEDVVTLVKSGTLGISPDLIGLLLSAQVFLLEWMEGLRSDRSYAPDTGAIDSLSAQMTEFSTTQGPEGSQTEEDDPLEAEFNALLAEYKARAEAEVTPIEKPTAPVEPEALTTTQAGSPPTPPCAALDQPSRRGSPADSKDHQAKSQEGTLRISAQRLDELIQLIGELSIHEGILYESRRTGTLGSRSSLHALQLSHKIVRELHEKALSLRMHPLGQLFQRLERVARDVARTQGKSINVQIAGQDTELDKAVIEQMSDPLVHILRNAVDHGIEGTADRERAGKAPSATIRLTASSDPSGITISVEDDGRGLNEERILAKAREKGLIHSEDRLSPAEIHRLIFKPGFSTAETISDISGRGVGMDVVLRAIEALRGDIQIQSDAGKGTAFRITLPTSLSIVDALIVRIDQSRYAVPVHDLTEIIDLGSYFIERTSGGHSMLSLRGSAVPVHRLHNYLMRDRVEANSEHTNPALVVRYGESAVAFAIDEVVTQQQVVVRPLSNKLSGLPGISGCTILGDGEPGMILSLQEIARQCLTH